MNDRNDLNELVSIALKKPIVKLESILDLKYEFDGIADLFSTYESESEANQKEIDSAIDELEKGDPLSARLFRYIVSAKTDIIEKSSELEKMTLRKMYITALMRSGGYDGQWDKHITGYKDIEQIIAFYPNQIKSATDNTGTFSADNPDIRYQRVLEEPDFGDEETPRETAQETLKNAEIPPEVTAQAVEEAMAKLKEQEVGQDEELPANAMDFDFKDEEELVDAILPEDMEDAAREETVKEIQAQLDEDRTEHAAAAEVLAESEEAEKAAQELFSDQDAKQFAEEAREYGIRIDNNKYVQELFL
jgi:hypothetical protein